MGKRLSSPDFLVQTGPLRSMGRLKERLDKWKVDKTGLFLPQAEPLRDEDYRRWIAGLPCCVCGRGDVQCAHVRYGLAGGTGYKPSDDRTVPLCIACHRDQGPAERRFWQYHGIDPVLLAAWLRETYLVDPNDRERALYVISQCRPKEGI